jgi:hypothetical protein
MKQINKSPYKRYLQRLQTFLTGVPRLPSDPIPADLAKSISPENELGPFAEMPAATPFPSDHNFIIQNTATPSAYTCIENILQLNCVQPFSFNVRACYSSIPPALKPTWQQKLVPHKPYIDMLPWPLLRDRLLASQKSINEEEFCRDMCSAEVKIWGSMPGDPTGWEIGPQFTQKW